METLTTLLIGVTGTLGFGALGVGIFVLQTAHFLPMLTSQTIVARIRKAHPWLIAAVLFLIGPFGSIPFVEAQLSDYEMQKRRTHVWEVYAKSVEVNLCVSVPSGGRMKDQKTYPPDGICDVGDSVLLNALLCYSGNQFACDAVKNSMDDDGRLWRSPVHARPQGWPHAVWKNGRWHYPGDPTDFSKDHTLGFLLYLAVTRDKDAAMKWLDWLDRSGNVFNLAQRTFDLAAGISQDIARDVVNGVECLGQGMPCINNQVKQVWEDLTYKEKIACGIITVILPPVGLFCPAIVYNGKKLVKEEKFPKYITLFMPKVCDDVTCELLPDQYALMYNVFDSLGLIGEVRRRALIEQTTPYIPVYPASKNMLLFQHFAGEPSLVKDANSLIDYQLHLKAVTVLLKRVTGRGATANLIRTLHKRDTNNPFHQYLLWKFVDGNAYTMDGLRQRVFKLCPATPKAIRQGRGHQWAWKRSNPDRPEDEVKEAAKNSMGWDCIFMANLLGVRSLGLSPFHANALFSCDIVCILEDNYLGVLGTTNPPDDHDTYVQRLTLEGGKALSTIHAELARSDKARLRVEAMFQDIVGRSPETPSDSAFIDELIVKLAGIQVDTATLTGAVLYSFCDLACIGREIAKSPQSYTNIEAIYLTVLGPTTNSPAGHETYLQRLAVEGVKALPTIHAELAKSDEARLRVEAMFQDIVGRSPETPSDSAFIDELIVKLGNYAMSCDLTCIRREIVYSPQSSANVETMFQDMVGHAAASQNEKASLDDLVTKLADGSTSADVYNVILNSDYFLKSLNALLQSILGRAYDPAIDNTWGGYWLNAANGVPGYRNSQELRETIARDAHPLVEAIYWDVMEIDCLSACDSYLGHLATGASLDDVRVAMASSDDAYLHLNDLYQEIWGRDITEDEFRPHAMALSTDSFFGDERAKVEAKFRAIITVVIVTSLLL